LRSIYLLLDAESFGKRDDGSMPLAVRCLLGPYLLGAWLNSRWWTRKLAAADPVLPGILLGRLPSAGRTATPAGGGDRRSLCRVAVSDARYPHTVVPMLDLVEPTLAASRNGVGSDRRSTPGGTGSGVLRAWLRTQCAGGRRLAAAHRDCEVA
jgi:hypothetical protein